MLTGKRILLVISGGIAAFKALDLIRRLRAEGCTVRCVLTASATEFVTPLSVAALSAQPVYQDLFSLKDESEMGHIQLSREADLVVVAPATANLIAKMAAGIADDLASTTLLATDKPILIAPAMNVRMWHHAATQRNIDTLRHDGVRIVGPARGALADGESGAGRLVEPADLVVAIAAALANAALSLAFPPWLNTMRETPAPASSSISASAVGALERFQLNEAIRSGRGSKPTASQSPAAAIHSASFSGSSMSASEITARVAPAANAIRIASGDSSPPATCSGVATKLATAPIDSMLTGAAARAPSKSTRWISVAPRSTKCRAIRAG